MTSPADVLDLRLWKLTLPIGAEGSPMEIKQPALATYSNTDYCCVPLEGGVRFRAPVNGVTTSGSDYPRSELRETAAAGKLASWSGKSGTHTLIVNEAFTALPAVKPHVVGVQIHDASKDWTTFRCEGTKLYVTKGDNSHYRLVTDSYVLGTRFEARYVVAAGKITAFYNGAPVATMSASKLKGGYFKTGAYVQANCTNSTPCSPANCGEVTVYSVSVTHAA